jgi:phosphoglycolate phosphatase-like HAD superfamily hydrolase
MEKAKTNLIVFDMDGVLIDVSRSYRATVRKTATLFFQPAIGAGKLPRPLFDLADLAAVKQCGGLNNDWDLTHRVLGLLSTKIDGMEIYPGQEGWQLYEHTIRNCDVRRLAAFLNSSSQPLRELMQSDNQPRIKFIDQMYLGDVGSGNIIKQIFQEIYLGRKLFEHTYTRPCKVSKEDGLINREALFPDHGQLEALRTRNVLAIATGRPRAEAEHPMAHYNLSGYFAEMLTLDDCLAEERRREENSGDVISLSKPHPYMLDTVSNLIRTPVENRIYVGDMPDDMVAATRSESGYIGVGMTISAGDKTALGNRLRQAGAERVVADFNELHQVLSQL